MGFRNYRRLAVSQEILGQQPMTAYHRGIKFNSLISCSSRLNDKSKFGDKGFVNIVSDGNRLFSLRLEVWNWIIGSDLIEDFDNAICGRITNFGSVISRVREFFVRSKSKFPAVLRRYLFSDPVINPVSEDIAVVKSWRAVGVRHCGNSWVCPVCTPTKLYAAQVFVQRYIDEAYYIGLYPVMLTFTVSHKVGESLDSLFRVYKGKGHGVFDCWRKSKAYKDFVSLCAPLSDGKPYMPFVSVGEVTIRMLYDKYRKALRKGVVIDDTTIDSYCGWHLHYHALYFVRRDAMLTYKQMIPALKASWASAAVTATEHFLGRIPDENDILKVGLDCGVKPASTSRYLCKVEDKENAWGADRELTYSSGKHCRFAGVGAHINPFSLLDHSTPFHRLIWASYCAGTRHKHRFDSSKGLSAFFASAVAQEQIRRAEVQALLLAEHESRLDKWSLVTETASGSQSVTYEREKTSKVIVTSEVILPSDSCLVYYSKFSSICSRCVFYRYFSGGIP